MSTAATSRFQAPAELAAVGQRALVVGGVAAAACAIGAFLDPAQFFRSYLVGWLLWVGIAAGSLVLICIHHLTSGDWSTVILRQLEAAARTVPLCALLFLPVALGAHHLFEWTHADAVAADPLLQHKAPYLNLPFFLGRALLYFLLWSGCAHVLSRLSRRQDETRERELTLSLRKVAAPTLGIYGITGTFAGFDWLMSLEPHWVSSIYGIYFMGSQVLSALAFTVVVAAWLSAREPMKDVLHARHFHDHGNLLFAFVMLTSYFSLGQFMIIWSADIPEETVWYLDRLRGGWQDVGLLLVVGHFAIPFALLLSHGTKRRAARLGKLAAWLLVMRWVDMLWQAAPAFHPGELTVHWLDAATPVAVGGIWLFAFVRELRSRPLLPVGAPNLLEAVGQHG